MACTVVEEGNERGGKEGKMGKREEEGGKDDAGS